ncbi:MAG: Phenylacetate--CoA ligase [Bacteroidota bacterium]
MINLRSTLFWMFDFIQGSPVKSHYRDIEFINQNFSCEKAQAKVDARLMALLQHAKSTVPFYIDQSGNLNNLNSFPVINKKLIMNASQAFQSSSFLNNNNHKVITSGTTGNPFIVFQDGNKKNRNSADTLYFANRAGYRLGEKLFYLRLWDKQYVKSKLSSFAQNMSASYSVDDLNDVNIERLLKELTSDNNPKHILGYVSAIESILKYIEAKKGNLSIKSIRSIIGVAELMNDFVRQKSKEYFGQNIISRYSNSENGILAQQTEGKLEFEINTASYTIEILEMESDTPVAEGQSGRIIVTDYYNYAMPLIRYDTGDVGSIIFKGSGNARKPVLKYVEGRKMDMFTNTNGEYISSHIIHHLLQYPGISQFQFIQEKNFHYQIKLKITPTFNLSKEAEIIQIYKEYFGETSVVEVVYVDEIPLLPSGKYKLVINKSSCEEQNPARLKPRSSQKIQL